MSTASTATTLVSSTTSTDPTLTHPHYSFPPFFTRQPNTTTRTSQTHSWRTLILSYCQHHRLFTLAADFRLFHNTILNRRLSPTHTLEVLSCLVDAGEAEWVDPSAKGEVLVFWRKPEEWASLIGGWVEDTGQRGGVMTFWELREGDSVHGTEFEAMDARVLKKALQVLVKRGQAQVFGGEGDEGGVKFF